MIGLNIPVGVTLIAILVYFTIILIDNALPHSKKTELILNIIFASVFSCAVIVDLYYAVQIIVFGFNL